MQLLNADTTMSLKEVEKKIALKKLKKNFKGCTVISTHFFRYCPELPKRPKQNNSCFKMWLIDQLYIKLGTGVKFGLRLHQFILQKYFDKFFIHVP